MDQEIIDNYRNPEHPTAFSAPGTVARYYNISKKRAKKLLESIDSYVLHREYKRPRKFNPYYIYKPRTLIQADLIEIRTMSEENEGINYLLLIIDVFTRKIWVYPLKDKQGNTVRDALNTWIQSLRVKPKVFSTDGGKEFWNNPVKTLLRRYNIELQLAVGTSKAAYAERANKTLQIIIYKYLSDKETLKYIDVLDKLVDSYNNRGHRSLEYYTPNEAEQRRNTRTIREIAMKRFNKIKKKSPVLKVGQKVRIKTDAKQIVSSRRAYAEQFHGEYYIITRINDNLPIPVYFLQSMDDGQDIKGSFYKEELQPVEGDTFKIERVLRWRGRGRNRQGFVRWKYFGPRWDQWIPAADIQNIT